MGRHAHGRSGFYLASDAQALEAFVELLLGSQAERVVKSLQNLIEKNLEALLGIRFLVSEYSLQKIMNADILPTADGTQEFYGPTETGTGKVNDETEKLSTLIDVVNDRFGTDFDAQDLLDGVTNQLFRDAAVQQAAAANDRTNVDYLAGRRRRTRWSSATRSTQTSSTRCSETRRSSRTWRSAC